VPTRDIVQSLNRGRQNRPKKMRKKRCGQQDHRAVLLQDKTKLATRVSFQFVQQMLPPRELVKKGTPKVKGQRHVQAPSGLARRNKQHHISRTGQDPQPRPQYQD